MTFPYRQYEVLPSPGQPEGLLHRPVIPVRVVGPTAQAVVLALVDTGSDVTVLPALVRGLIDVTAEADEQAHFRGVSGQVVTARFSQVNLSLAHTQGVWRWSATVGFLEGRDVAILGHAGFLQYFHATFDSERHRLSLRPNKRLAALGKTE